MEQRVEFVNRSQGWVGVRRLNRKDDEFSDVVEPGGRVFLNEEEQTLTAQAHRRPEDSPFVTRRIQHYDPLTQDVTATFDAPLLEQVEKDGSVASAAPDETSEPRRRREPANA